MDTSSSRICLVGQLGLCEIPKASVTSRIRIEVRQKLDLFAVKRRVRVALDSERGLTSAAGRCRCGLLPCFQLGISPLNERDTRCLETGEAGVRQMISAVRKPLPNGTLYASHSHCACASYSSSLPTPRTSHSLSALSLPKALYKDDPICQSKRSTARRSTRTFSPAHPPTSS